VTIRMVPAAVSRAGDDLERLSAEAKGWIETAFHTTDTAVSDNPGWSSTSMLVSCRRAWSTRAGELIDRTTRLGVDLADSAAGVSAADAEATRRLHDVLDGLAAQ